MLQSRCIPILSLALCLAACSENKSSYSILATSEVFQEANNSINSRVDVLWIVDNSHSMLSSQQALTQNFPSFMTQFVAKNLDFQMAVATSDAYLADPMFASFYTNFPFLYDSGQPQSYKAKFRDGVGSTHTGVFTLLPSTLDLNNTFVTNALQGVDGYGDERPFQSMMAALDSSHNTGFVRNDGFLAVISLSDEDDFSWNGTGYLDGQYADNRLYTIDDMVDYLDTKTGSTATRKKYSFNSIAIQDAACLATLNNSFSGRRIGTRLNALADDTEGQKLSLCGDFATGLQDIAEQILTAATEYFLTREPIPSSITVVLDGANVPEASTSGGQGGWTYHAPKNSISFSGNYLPANGSVISVSFDPAGLNL